MKYNMGDKVRVKKDLICDGGLITENMANRAGQIVTIKLGFDDHYYIMEDAGYIWKEEFFEPIYNSPKKISCYQLEFDTTPQETNIDYDIMFKYFNYLRINNKI